MAKSLRAIFALIFAFVLGGAFPLPALASPLTPAELLPSARQLKVFKPIRAYRRGKILIRLNQGLTTIRSATKTVLIGNLPPIPRLR